jgi:hypothetical protein
MTSLNYQNHPTRNGAAKNARVLVIQHGSKSMTKNRKKLLNNGYGDWHLSKEKHPVYVVILKRGADIVRIASLSTSQRTLPNFRRTFLQFDSTKKS